jgi:uncharacterized protein (TIGR00255 family)
MLSMTGFGKSEVTLANGCTLTAELSSVNRKQLEIRITMPSELAPLEISARKWVSEEVTRGAVQLKITCAQGGKNSGKPVIDTAFLEELVRSAAQVRKNTGLSPEVAVESLFSVPGVISAANIDPQSPVFAEGFERVIRGAMASYHFMREVEGNALKADFLDRIAVLENLLRQIEPMVRFLDIHIRKRLEEKLKNANLPIDTNDERLLKEVLFYADKADVTEEITRLHSHISQFKNFLNEEKPVGRSLDFLLQEFFREITTLGNKAGASEVSPLVVAFKSELEKLREQIQNVE